MTSRIKKRAPFARRRSFRLPWRRELESQIVWLAKSGRLADAAKVAIESQQSNGLSITFIEDNVMVRLHPDGTREQIVTIKRPTYNVPRGVARL